MVDVQFHDASGRVLSALNIVRRVPEPELARALAGETVRTPDRTLMPLPPGGEARVCVVFHTKGSGQFRVADAAKLLGKLRDQELTTSSVTRIIVPELADACILDVVEQNGAIQKREIAAEDPEKHRMIRELRHYAPGSDSKVPAAVAMRTKAAVVIPKVSPEQIDEWASSPEQREVLRALAPRSTIAVPLLVRGEALGALTLHRFASSLPFSKEDVPIVDEIARFAAVALENARLFEALESARGRLHRILMDAPFAIAVRRGPTHILEFVNKRDLELAGRHDLVGKTFAETFPGVGTELAALDAAYRDGHGVTIHELTGEAIDRGGKAHRVYLDFVVQPTRDDKGHIDGIISFTIDVSQQVRARKEMELLAESLRKAVRVRDEFLSIASHELKTPLTALRLQVQGLLRAARMPDAGRFAPERVTGRLDAIDRNVDRLAALIDKLLSLPHLVSGRVELDREQMDLTELVEEVAARFADELARAGSTLTMHLALRVQGNWDRLRIDQVVTNLLANAVKYGRGRPIEITLEDRGANAFLRVKDRGIGIALQDHQRVFERFERAVSERNYGGFGLGLYITRHIVLAHGGEVSVESEPGEGATFDVVLPKG